MLIFLGVLCVVSQTVAEENQPKTPTGEPLKIDAGSLAILIKSSIVALQQANQTGNYSVLRDLGTSVFRDKFDQTRLASIFSNLRARGISLSPIIVLTPTLMKQPELTAQNQLHVSGYFPTQPLQIQFDLVFLMIDGVWRIEGISVDTAAAQPLNSASAPSAQLPSQGHENPPVAGSKPDKKAIKAPSH